MTGNEFIKCTKCGSEVCETNKFCSVCGQKIELIKICHKCGIKNNEEDIFCENCGQNLSTEIEFEQEEPKQEPQNVFKSGINCPYCGSNLARHASKCPECGEWLKKKKPFGCYSIFAILFSITIFLVSLIISYITTSDGAMSFGIAIVATIVIFFALWFYFLPSWIAELKKHSSAGAIFAVNFLFGWSVVGWVVALIWALSNDNKH